MSRQSVCRRWVIIAVLLLMLTGCSGEQPKPTPTEVSGVGNAAIALLEKNMYLQLTEQAITNETIKNAAIMTATQQMLDVTATAARHAENLQATQAAGEATKQAWVVTVSAAPARDTATVEANKTSTQQAML